jgi:site-specific recombinase XerD
MHSVSDPARVRFGGPLERFATGLAEELASLGYASTSATIQLQLAAHLSRWLGRVGVDPMDLTDELLDRFLVERRRDYTNLYSRRALGPILGYLRRVGAVPQSVEVPPETPAQVLLARFAGYLTGRRALSAPVVTAYVHWVRPFVEQVLCPVGVLGPRDVSALELARFLADRLPAMSRKSAQMTATAHRSLLRFVHAESIVSVNLVDAVPSVASRRLSGLPQALTPQTVQALMDACGGADPVARRDQAVIVMMRRLGLRCGEIAALRLDDVDWVNGTVTVAGKSGRVDRMPLPVDVGEALVGYLRHGRPGTTERCVFVRVVAPFTPLRSSSVSCIVARAARRAGLGTIHGHRLRHTAATETLNAGAGLEEVAQLMRHAGAATTVVYAKTDRTRLGALARPWPSLDGAR